MRKVEMTPANLTARRKALGLNQTALAERLGVHARTVSAWETSRQTIPGYLELALQTLERPLEEYDMRSSYIVELILQHGVAQVAKAVNSIPLMLTEGWDLTGWEMVQAPGAVLFRRWGTGTTPAEQVLCVNASARDRPAWSEIAAEAGAPTLLLMTPGGRLDR